MVRLHVGDGGRAEVDGGGGGQWVGATDENTESTEVCHKSQLDGEAELVAGVQVGPSLQQGPHCQLHHVVTDSTDYPSCLCSPTVITLKGRKYLVISQKIFPKLYLAVSAVQQFFLCPITLHTVHGKVW